MDWETFLVNTLTLKRKIYTFIDTFKQFYHIYWLLTPFLA